MTKPGLTIESAASVTLRDVLQQHMNAFGPAIARDRAASQSVVAAYIDGLAGAVALAIAGRQGYREDMILATIEKFRECVNRDLVELARRRGVQ